MTQEVLKLALDALIWTTGSGDFGEGGYAHEGAKKCLFPAITAIKEALAQTQEPVAAVTSETGADITMSWWHEPALPIGTKLFTYAPQRTWVGLAAEDRLTAKYMQDAPDGIEAVIDYIEAKLKELNT